MPVQFIDLHVHTTASDGSDSPTEVVRRAAAARLAALAVTDHDTLSGLDEAEAEGRRLGLRVIRGCELSAGSEYGEIHLLGLWLPRQCPQVEARLAVLRERRLERNARILERLRELGMALTLDDVREFSGGESMGRPHIALAMKARGYVKDTREAMRTYLARGCPAFVPKAAFAPEEAVTLLASAGATVAFAHPMLLRCPPSWREALIQQLIPHGLHAIEAYHSEHSAADERACVELATRYGLTLTGGSDYHGITKPRIAVGRGKGGLRVTLAVLERLIAQRRALGLPVDGEDGRD